MYVSVLFSFVTLCWKNYFTGTSISWYNENTSEDNKVSWFSELIDPNEKYIITDYIPYIIIIKLYW